MRGYEWENDEEASIVDVNEEFRINIKTQEALLGSFYLPKRWNVLCLYECGFYSIFDCIIVQLYLGKEKERVNERPNKRAVWEIRESQLKALDWNQHFSSFLISSGLPPHNSLVLVLVRQLAK